MMFFQNKIWKWGSNWNGMINPSHYEFMKDEKIVVGIISSSYSAGDLVIITNGFTVKAIAMIEDKPKAITENQQYAFVEDKYKIPYKDWVNYAKAEWYELPEDKVFEYKVQRGIVVVQKTDIKEKVFELWNGRNK